MADDSELTSDVVAVFADWDARDARQAAKDELREALWEVIATVRDAAPRRVDDADSYDVVDALLAGPLAPLLAKVQAVEALADPANCGPLIPAAEIRRALGGEPRG